MSAQSLLRCHKGQPSLLAFAIVFTALLLPATLHAQAAGGGGDCDKTVDQTICSGLKSSYDDNRKWAVEQANKIYKVPEKVGDTTGTEENRDKMREIGKKATPFTDIPWQDFAGARSGMLGKLGGLFKGFGGSKDGGNDKVNKDGDHPKMDSKKADGPKDKDPEAPSCGASDSDSIENGC